MPRIPTYQAGKLASEAVGVPPQDRGGVSLAQSFADLAGKAANIAETALTKQRALMQKAALTKAVSQFDSDMMVVSNEIRNEYLSNPDEGVKVLDEKRNEIFNQYKEGIEDAEVKLAFDAFGAETKAKGQALDRVWAFNENNKIIQKDYFDRFNSDIAFAGQTDSLDEVIQKASLLEEDREGIYQAWGGVLEGSKVIDSAQEGLVKSYFYNQLSKGNAFKVLKEIEDGRLGSAEGGAGLVDPLELKTMKNQALKMAKAGVEDAGALALINAVQTNFKLDDLLRQPIAETEEQINELSFQIAKKAVLVEAGQVSEDEVNTLKAQQKLLQKVRDTQLSRSNMYIAPDPAVEAEMTARFGNLFKKGKVAKGFKTTLDEVFTYQQDLMDNRDKIDPKTFKKLNFMVEKAFQDDINGYVRDSKFGTKKAWFGLGGLEAEDKKGLSGSKKLQTVFSKAIATFDPEQGNEEIYETLKFFFDDMDEMLSIEGAPVLEMTSQKQFDELLQGAKAKMQLQKMGLPVYMGEKDVVYKAGIPYVIVGFDNDGVPLVDPK